MVLLFPVEPGNKTVKEFKQFSIDQHHAFH